MVAEQFGPYRLDELIGRGGMGEVYRAYDTVKKRTVALKRLPVQLAGDTDFQARFRREAEVAAGLTDPHIIPIHDFGEIDGQLFIDMRLISGVELSGLIQENGPLPPVRAVAIVVQLASALAAAHAARLTHRDVKPSNVLISQTDRGEDFVHLVDFGIARTDNATILTATGSAVGTIDYMAPELLLHEQSDYRVDIYALGCVLYEALTAQRPFPGTGLAAKMYAHVHNPPPVPSQHQPGLPPALDDVVARAMAKDPAHRFQTTTELAAMAQDAVSGQYGPPVTPYSQPSSSTGTAPLTTPPTPWPTLVGAPQSDPQRPVLPQTANAQWPGQAPAPPQPFHVPMAAPRNERPRRRPLVVAGLATAVVLIVAVAVVGYREFGASTTSQATAPSPSTALPPVSTAAPASPAPIAPPGTEAIVPQAPRPASGSFVATPLGSTIRHGQIVYGEIGGAGTPSRYRLDVRGASAFAVTEWQGPAGACALEANLVGGSVGPVCADGAVRFSVSPSQNYELEITGGKLRGTGRYQFRVVTYQ